MNARKDIWKGLVPVALSFLLLLANSEAVAQLRLSDEAVSGAACATASSASYALLEVIGQPQPIGTFSSGNIILEAGLIPFLTLPDEALPVDDLSQTKLSREAADAFAAEIPEAFDLHQNFPNPFNPETSIRYQLPEAGWVRLRIYNVLGEEIALLQDGEVEAGHHRVTWNGKDRKGQPVASGIYLYRLEVQAVNGERFASTKKMNLLR